MSTKNLNYYCDKHICLSAFCGFLFFFHPKQTSNSEKPNNSGEISERLEKPKPLTSYKELDSNKVAIVDPYVAKEPEVIAQYPWFYENRSYRNYVRIVSQTSQSNSDSDDD